MSQKPTHCLHCDQPLAQEQEESAEASSFCCNGCSWSYRLLREAGLLRYYDLRRGTNAPAAEPQGFNRPLTWLPPLLEKAPRKNGVVELSVDVQGIHCAACVWLLEKLFVRRPGALRIEVNPGLGRLVLFFEEDRFPIAEYLLEIARFGYTTGPKRKTPDASLSDLVVRFGICAAIAMNSMIFSASSYFGLSGATDPQLFRLFSVANFVLTIACVGIGGSVFLRSAYLALLRGIVHLDAPIALGIVLSFCGSAWSFLYSSGDAVYFDTVNIFITLMLLGRLLSRRVVSANKQVLLTDEGIETLSLRRINKDGTMSVVPAGAIQSGDELLLAPGELLPVLARPALPGEFSLAWIDGEATPRSFVKGALVPAGAHNVGRQALRLIAEENFSASALHQLLCPPAQAQAEVGAGESDLWQKIAGYYVVSVLALSALAFASWTLTDHGVSRALEVTIALLVVTCPCAIGLTTPLAYQMAQSHLRKLGLFVRSGSFLDRALSVRKVLFDKTGTLTLAEMALANPSVTLSALEQLPQEDQGVLFQMVSRSNHPKSRALLAALSKRAAIAKAPVFDDSLVVEEIPGVGLRTATHTLAKDGAAEDLLFCRGETVLGRFSFVEELRHDARAEIAALSAMGMEIFLLSGDHKARVQSLAERLQIPTEHAHGGLAPKDKAAFIEALHKAGTPDTLMIGDGINDALAFSVAHCAGTPAVERPMLPARSDFYYLGGGVGPLSKALMIAYRTRRTISRGLVVAFSYNALVVALALAGKMNPILCALAMPASSIVSVLLSVSGMRRPLDDRDVSDSLRQRNLAALWRSALFPQPDAAGPRPDRAALAPATRR